MDERRDFWCLKIAVERFTSDWQLMSCFSEAWPSCYRSCPCACGNRKSRYAQLEAVVRGDLRVLSWWECVGHSQSWNKDTLTNLLILTRATSTLWLIENFRDEIFNPIPYLARHSQISYKIKGTDRRKKHCSIFNWWSRDILQIGMKLYDVEKWKEVNDSRSTIWIVGTSKLQVLNAVYLLVVTPTWSLGSWTLKLASFSANPGGRVHIDTITTWVHSSMTKTKTDRSIQVPGNLEPTREGLKPPSLNCFMYQGSILAERRRTRPPIFRAWFSLRACSAAASSAGSNQSIESII